MATPDEQPTITVPAPRPPRTRVARDILAVILFLTGAVLTAVAVWHLDPWAAAAFAGLVLTGFGATLATER